MPLFTRTHPVPASAPAPAPETWMPEGTLVSQRYRALEGATVQPRGVPARPKDPEAVDLVRSRLWRHRYGTSPRAVHLSDFNALRVDLQRSTPWIKALLESLTQTEPSFITATPTSSGQATRFTVQPFGRP
ncbi:hypothetical protein [Streptomyces anulatus]|uniref:hypothetical protein n=1 Tax=Streptomyces anulatus TaxID=1892 RepID=UPI00341B0380